MKRRLDLRARDHRGGHPTQSRSPGIIISSQHDMNMNMNTSPRARGKSGSGGAPSDGRPRRCAA
eukprot:726599-Prymnesium_polylepis.2